mmetsp:Transcript_37234/g.99096  ORF Transcript_37234/g.99096 Transcript_37234/m.99096 type:complete len:251 (-) Transcript_37234:533-1285(-)
MHIELPEALHPHNPQGDAGNVLGELQGLDDFALRAPVHNRPGLHVDAAPMRVHLDKRELALSLLALGASSPLEVGEAGAAIPRAALAAVLQVLPCTSRHLLREARARSTLRPGSGPARFARRVADPRPAEELVGPLLPRVRNVVAKQHGPPLVVGPQCSRRDLAPERGTRHSCARVALAPTLGAAAAVRAAGGLGSASAAVQLDSPLVLVSAVGQEDGPALIIGGLLREDGVYSGCVCARGSILVFIRGP